MSDPQPMPAAVADNRDPDFQDAYPRVLLEREFILLRRRRRDAKLPPSDLMAGVGLSGGGIRSATFALGIFQGMAKSRNGGSKGGRPRRGLLRYIDYLSTVSGGGYFGSFFGQLLTRDYVQTPDDVEDILLQKKEKRVLDFLRENGRYLSPNGGGDALLFGSAILRNWVSIHVVLALFTLSLFLGLQFLRTFLGFAEITPKPADLVWWSPLLWLPALTFVLAAVPLGWAYWLVKPERQAIAEGSGSSTDQEDSATASVAALLLVFVASSLFAVFTWEDWKFFPLWLLLALIAALAFGFLKLAGWRLPDDRSMEAPQERDEKVWLSIYRNHALRNRLGLWVTGALVATALLLVVATVDSLGQTVYAVLTGGKGLGPWLAAAFGSLGVLAGFARSIAMFFSKGPQGGRPSLPVALIATVAALIIVLLLLVTIDAGSHAIAFGLKPPAHAPAGLLETKEGSSYEIDVRGGPASMLDLRFRSASPQQEPGGESGERNAMLALLGFASTLLLSILFGQTWPFVNRSSHLPLYAARLTRAYLGASNPKRRNGNNITQPVEGDDSDLSRYWPPPSQNGAPIHLINVTINETIDGRSQVQQQDRKGIGLALGPWGISAGVRHHVVVPLGDEKKMQDPEEAPIFAIYPERKTGSEFRVFDYQEKEGAPRFSGEALPVGTWLSISGAAFSTGTGMRTSLGLSLLAGLANVRLGRWWDSGVVRQPPEKRSRRKISLQFEDGLARLFPVQTYLLDEFLARFPGTSRRHWYLSDGGHFENMGGYELLRRRLRFILIVDAEMDADFTFGGLANLVRKARIDFGAEVHFLTEEQLDIVVNEDVRPYIGTLAQLQRGEWKDMPQDESKPHGRLEKPDREGFSLAHAALARVTYASDGAPEAYSWLLYVKPTLTGREPVDVLEYHAAHPIFPHESTIDQFFDESQWESYRRLGEHIADVLFGCIDTLVPEGDATTLLKDWKWKPEGRPVDVEVLEDLKKSEGPQTKETTKVLRIPRYS